MTRAFLVALLLLIAAVPASAASVLEPRPGVRVDPRLTVNQYRPCLERGRCDGLVITRTRDGRILLSPARR